MLEHLPWVGKNFETGIAGQKFALVGYSHWRDDGDPDHKNVTRDILQDVIKGEKNIPFFNQIKNYFGFSEHEDFWNRVMFFNLVPFSIGGPDNRFDSASKQQIELAQRRFFRLLREYEPAKVIVFSKKGWSQCPSSLEEADGGHCKQFGSSFPHYFERATYRGNKSTIAAYGLRHTQGAELSLMKSAIRYVLADRLNDLGDTNV